ncbi:MAG: hypothetical protein WC340_11795 [Kiritimatiellia bacterium]
MIAGLGTTRKDIAKIWLRLGETQSRTRNDRENSIRVSVKEVYLYPLANNFKDALCHDHA